MKSVIVKWFVSLRKKIRKKTSSLFKNNLTQLKKHDTSIIRP